MKEGKIQLSHINISKHSQASWCKPEPNSVPASTELLSRASLSRGILPLTYPGKKPPPKPQQLQARQNLFQLPSSSFSVEKKIEEKESHMDQKSSLMIKSIATLANK